MATATETFLEKAKDHFGEEMTKSMAAMFISWGVLAPEWSQQEPAAEASGDSTDDAQKTA